MARAPKGLGYKGKFHKNNCGEKLIELADEVIRLTHAKGEMERCARLNKIGRLAAEARLELIQIPVSEE